MRFLISPLILAAVLLGATGASAQSSYRVASAGPSARIVSDIEPYRSTRSASPRISLKEDAVRLLRNPPRNLKGETALGCVAVSIYHEARGESINGQRAVASVIIQRALVRDRWGSSICGVTKPVQFSYLRGDLSFAPITDKAAWKLAIQIAAHTLKYGPLPELRHADHYHATSVDPKWRYSMVRIGRVGNHIFYSDPDSKK